MATGFNTQVGNGEYRLQFETDNKEHYLLMQETARRCVDGKQGTNADQIRDMSDEKLAILFTRAVADGCPPKMDWHCRKNEDGWDACDACWCKWLKQPAEGE